MSYCLLLGYYNFYLMHCSWDINSARGASQNKKNKKKKTLESKTHYWFNNQGIRYALLIVTFWQWSVGGSFYFHINFWVKQPWILVVRMNGWTSTKIYMDTCPFGISWESCEPYGSELQTKVRPSNSRVCTGSAKSSRTRPNWKGQVINSRALFGNVHAIFI